MNRIAIYTIAGLVLSGAGMGYAAPRPGDVAQGDPWQAAPNDFNFGNHIDTHIQLELKANKNGPTKLKGSLYVILTGATDSASGLPVARHPRGASHNEVCGVDPIVCLAGWHLDGLPGAARFLYHEGVNGDDHPVWLTNRAEESTAPAPGMVIPEPGSFTHFHWISKDGDDPRAETVSAECDKNNAGQLETETPIAVNEVCEGWYLQIKAVREFAFQHGGEIIPIYLGTDNRSHLNLVTNYKPLPEGTITGTRPGDH